MASPKHIAYIMDGNGRWGEAHGQSRVDGHRAGFNALKRVIEAAAAHHLPAISFFAFSTENWSRPPAEVNFLMQMLREVLHNPKTLAWLSERQIRIVWNGLPNLEPTLYQEIHDFVAQTATHSGTVVQIMFNYGARQMIAAATTALARENKPITPESITLKLNPYHLPPLDLLVRTGGELRVSNFMLWELSYAELIFRPVYWPDYDAEWFVKDLAEFSRRHRRFGGLNDQAPHQGKRVK